MDIFEYADSINWAADYLDMHTGYIYLISCAPDRDTIYVKDSDGNMIGVCHRV